MVAGFPEHSERRARVGRRVARLAVQGVHEHLHLFRRDRPRVQPSAVRERVVHPGRVQRRPRHVHARPVMTRQGGHGVQSPAVLQDQATPTQPHGQRERQKQMPEQRVLGVHARLWVPGQPAPGDDGPFTGQGHGPVRVNLEGERRTHPLHHVRGEGATQEPGEGSRYRSSGN